MPQDYNLILTMQGDTPAFDVAKSFENAQALVQGQKYPEAEKLCRQIVAHDANHDRALHMLGFLNLIKGQPERALELLEQSKNLGNTNPLMNMHLGIARAAQNDVEGSVVAFRDAIDELPSLAPAHFNLGLSLKKLGQKQDAEQALCNALEHDPNHADAAYELAALITDGGERIDAAEQAVDQVLQIDPQHVGALNLKAQILSGDERNEEARSLFEKALSIKDNLPELHMNFGQFLLGVDGRAAIESFQKAIDLDPQFPNAQASLAVALERTNRIDEALSVAQDVLTDAPESYMARMTLVRCHMRYGNINEALCELDRVNLEALLPRQRHIAQKTRAILLARNKDHARAFQMAQDANQFELEHAPLHFENSEDLYAGINTLKTWFTDERVSRWPKQIDGLADNPVFFVGFPRSGTTLMEQILSAHPNFVSAGENDWVRLTCERLPGTYPDSLESLEHQDILDLQQTYWAFVQKRLGQKLNGKRLIDKMPLNILHLGFIRRIFPKAKILVSVRDPRDCVLSGFMQAFHRSRMMDQFLTLPSAARFYDAIMGAELHYREALKLDTFAFKYEDLVAAPRQTMQEILAFLDAPWDEAVLHHQDKVTSARTIATPSLRDVGEAVYTRATKRWMHYQDELAPIFPVLQPYIDHFGYD